MYIMAEGDPCGPKQVQFCKRDIVLKYLTFVCNGVLIRE